MRRTALLVPLLLLTACGQDVRVERTSQADPEPASPSAAAPSRAVPVPSRVPTVAPAPTPSPTPTRAAVPSPPPGPVEPAAQGDVDGDGTVDEVRVGEQLAVVLSGTGKTVRSAFDTDTTPAASGSEDVDRDGRAEVFLRTGQGSSTTFLTPFRWDGRTLAPLTLDGEQAELGIGGSATHGEGFSCTEQGTLVVRSASSDDGTSFTVTTTTYRIGGHRLVQSKRTTAQAEGMDDPRVGEAYLVDCRSVGEAG